MNKADFVHCHCHSSNSMLDGLGQPEEHVIRAKKLGFKYYALTEHGNIDSLIKFQKACKKHDIKGIKGSELYVCPDMSVKDKNRKHLSVWIKNETGFKNLCKMLTIANLEGFYYRPRVDYQTVLKYHEGLVFGTACLGSFIYLDKGKKFLRRLVELKKDDIYFEVMPHDIEEQHPHNKKIIRLAKKYNRKIIISNDNHYLKRGDWKAHEILLAIQRRSKWDDPNRWRFPCRGFHVRSTKEMVREAEKYNIYEPEYFTNTLEIAEKCSGFFIEQKEIQLPEVPELKGKDENDTLWKLCLKGFKKRFGHNIVDSPVYLERLKFEYDVITNKKFARYFLIVWELMKWCKKTGISTGSRGSCGGALTSYLLGIVPMDPLKHDLLFDRFINKERQDYPDIDIDFEDTKRHLVREHLQALYGQNNIAGISTFSRIKAKGAIQDVARVFDVPAVEVNSFTKLIDDTLEVDDCVQHAIDEFYEAEDFAREYPEVIKYARLLEGTEKTYSRHAGGLIVSTHDIGKSGRCNMISRNNEYQINWEKGDAEYLGLMKLDVLGLKLLSVLGRAKEIIKENHGIDINLEQVELEDKKVLKMINDGNTTGVFQFNTWSMTKFIKEMGISKFRHLVHAIALVRPGPLNSGLAQEYIERKHGKKWERKSDIYEDITKETHGILVFQEDIMNVIHKVAGLPYSTADNIRKIISKKRDKKQFEKYYEQFLKGCKKTKLFSQQEAKSFWDDLQKWSRYGFGLAHSVEYALQGYYSAFLKYYYPTEYICAALTHGSKNKKNDLIEEAYRTGLRLKLPKVGTSDPFKWVAKGNCLFVPFIEIKGIGDKVAPKAAKIINPKDKFYDGSNKNPIIKRKSKGTLIRHRGALGKKLNLIGAYSDSNIDVDDEIQNMFDFRVQLLSMEEYYPNLFGLFDCDFSFENIMKGNYAEFKKLAESNQIIQPSSFAGFRKLAKCDRCELRLECSRPVHPSPGKINVMIVGEAPGKVEDQKKKGFVGPAGKEIWKYLTPKGFDRELFPISNIVKCFPKQTRTPNKKQIDICSKRWLEKEIKKIRPKIILAFGNTCRSYFEGVDTGIINKSGTTSWSERHKSFICWCIHPSAILRNPHNKAYFNNGMRNFVKLLRIFKVKKVL